MGKQTFSQPSLQITLRRGGNPIKKDFAELSKLMIY